MQLTIDDVRKRIRKLSEGSNTKRDYNMEHQHESALHGNVVDALYCIENYHMTDYTNNLTSVLDLYDIVCENGSIAQIINATISVNEGVVSKTRDPEQTRTSIKRKLAHIKGKVSGKVRNNISNAMDDMNNITKNVKDNLSKNTSTIKDNVSNDAKKIKTIATKEEAIVFGCDSVLEAYDTSIHCDRVIDNYNNLSRRFNIDKVLNENTVDGIYETTINVCRLVDTYAVKTRVKINTVAETVWYGFAKHGIDTDKSKILEAVTDFYINKPQGVDECAYVLRENVFFSDSDKKSVSYISEFTMSPNYVAEAKTEKENKITFVSLMLGFDNVLNNVLLAGPWWLASNITKGAASAGKNTPLSGPLERLAKNSKIKHVIFENIKTHAMITGNYYGLRANLLAIVDNAPDKNFLDKLQHDAVYSVSMLETTADNMESAIEYKKKNGKPDPKYKSLYTWIEEGNSPEKIREHRKWIKDTYIPYIKSAKNKLKSSTNEATMIEDAIFEYTCNTKPHLAVSIDNDLKRVLESNTDQDDDNSKFDKIVNDFKKSEDDKKETKLKSLIISLYTKNIENIIDETPNLLGYIRNVFVLGSFAINPICGAIVAIADQFIKMHLQREETEEMLKALSAEIKKTQKKIEVEKNNDTKNRLEEYLKSLEDTHDKINEYYETLLTDNEINARYDADFEDKDSFSNILDDDSDSENDDWGDWDDDFNESHLSIIPKMERIMESISKHEAMDMVSFIGANISTIPYNLIVEFAKASIIYPEIIDPESYKTMIESNLKNIRTGKTDMTSLSSKYLLMGALNEANLLFTDSKISQAKCNDIYDAFKYTRSVNAVYEAANIVQNAYSSSAYPVMEMSFKNTLAMASEKLKKSMTDLSDKEKSVSRTIDTNMDSFSKAVERSLTNDNREAIIKGSILPSASRMLKMVLAGGITSALLGPVVAIIGVLGYIGTSTRYKAKERQMVLDEIEIELKMTQKYLDIAESKNDLKATKKLLTIQRNLERQRQRIKYKMAVETGKTNDPNDTPTDGID